MPAGAGMTFYRRLTSSVGRALARFHVLRLHQRELRVAPERMHATSPGPPDTPRQRREDSCRADTDNLTSPSLTDKS